MILFLDTNIWLHFRQLSDVQASEFGENLTVFVPRVTVRELNDEKDSNPKAKLKKRALAALKIIEEAGPTGLALSNGIIVKSYPKKPMVDWDSLDLDKNSDDDVLIATILNCIKQFHQEDVVFYSDDVNARMTAKDLGIQIRLYPEKYRLTELDDSEKEMEALKKQVHALQARIPKLQVSFVEDGMPVDIIKILIPRHYPQIDSETEELVIKQKKVELGYYEKTQDLDLPKGFIKTAARASALRTFEDVKNKKIASYLDELRRFVVNMNKFELEKALTFKIQICVINNGSEPAQDVDIILNVPFSLVFTHPPKAPIEPQPPKTISIIDRFDSFHQFPAENAMIFDPLRIEIDYLKSGGARVSQKFKGIKHNHTIQTDAFYITLPSFDAIKSFQLDYVVTCANLPAMIKGVLAVGIT